MSTVGVIFHCAAHVTTAHPYAAVRAANVAGTRCIVALALAARATLFHVSTLGFLDGGSPECLAEISAASLATRSGYAQSKYVAERVVARAAEAHGLRAVVFRPGVICGASQSGASNPRDAVSLLLLGLVREGVVSTDVRSPLPPSLNLCPVDCVAETIVQASVSGASRPIPPPAPDTTPGPSPSAVQVPVYHICAPKGIPLATLAEWVRTAGHPLRAVGAEAFCAMVRGVRDERHPLFPLKSLLLHTTATSSASVTEPCRGRATAEVMAATGRPCTLTQTGLAKALAFLSSAAIRHPESAQAATSPSHSPCPSPKSGPQPSPVCRTRVID